MHSINVTPLTDVLLVLLITFLLSATSFQEVSSEMPLPRVADAREVAESMTRVPVSSNGALEWPGGNPAGLSISASFARLRARTDKPVLALAVHRDLPYALLYEVMLAARQSGWERIVLLTEASP
jgi:biopolymer transport protein ExbD/biopolymer transport protein TolR